MWLHRDFTSLKDSWNLNANNTSWDITCVFHGHGFLLWHHRCHFMSTHSLRNTEVKTHTPRALHRKCNIFVINWYCIHSNSSALGVSNTRRRCINDELKIWPQIHEFFMKNHRFHLFLYARSLTMKGVGVYLGMGVYLNEYGTTHTHQVLGLHYR